VSFAIFKGQIHTHFDSFKGTQTINQTPLEFKFVVYGFVVESPRCV
jgi:hypothetical protein